MGLLMEGVERIYLDTNIFITAFETSGVLAEKAALLLLTAPLAGLPRLVTSELTLSELLVRPFRHNDEALIDTYTSLVSPSAWLTVQSVTRDIFLKAANLRAETPSLKLPDAVHAATAILSGCTHILSNDKGLDLQKMEAPAPTLLRPDEPTLTSLLESLAR
jgi:predicted nucleic acid-binding protein